MTSPIDPITFEVIQNGLSSIADEMALVIMRSAYSPVVRDSMDYSTALCDANGEVVAQGLTLAVQLGSFPDIMSLIVKEHGSTIMPGDVFIANDPYGSGGQHLPDIYIIKPLFVGSTLAGYATTMAHHSDVGGIAPGSVAIHARDIHQEGLRLPILKLYAAGEVNETLFKIIERNTRSPIQVLGDLRAQISSCQAGERGLAELVEKHGLGTLNVYFRALHDFAEKRMREEIMSMPDGVYNNLDHIDGVGDDPIQLDIAVRLEIKGSEILIDFEGTSPQVAAAINCPIPMVHSAAYCAIRCLAKGDIPNCEGYMRPISISAPKGSILNPLEPAACAARGVMGYRVFDAVMGALAQAMPESVIAGCEGGPILFSVGGSHEGRSFVLTEVMVGTWGARFGLDGEEGVSNPAANLSNQPIELIEAELPLRIQRYGLVPDSGGPGEYRGGLAFVREFEFLSDTAQFTVRSDRRRCPPYGVAGGETGSPSRNELIGRDGKARMIPTMPMQSFDQNSGDIVRTVSAGGGGYGKALQRSPMLVLEDVLDGKVTLEGARHDYGVVINDNEVDAKATLDLRSNMESLLQ
ncbi:hydantoinase B/oxoprolinase family protein [Sneathiella litorea]|uniref:Hydantoinase B/oxoprolinase family protein n=1 Tax=Sneathiella litorea TaxID=2606216 RepID=A0A6L8WA45_9PROT|nr:hydantoinase B/oxoprolinase family protein [Sneathiella litorea]MZR31484.1 hydantoinase B/oxoprolinase family protein [Sneathiella litorea]